MSLQQFLSACIHYDGTYTVTQMPPDQIKSHNHSFRGVKALHWTWSSSSWHSIPTRQICLLPLVMRITILILYLEHLLICSPNFFCLLFQPALILTTYHFLLKVHFPQETSPQLFLVVPSNKSSLSNIFAFVFSYSYVYIDVFVYIDHHIVYTFPEKNSSIIKPLLYTKHWVIRTVSDL